MDKDIPEIRVPDGFVFKRVPTDLTIIASTAESQKLQSWKNPSLPTIVTQTERDNDGIARAIEKRLRDNDVRHPESSMWRFWPPKLFDHLFDRDTVYQIVDQLITDGKLPVDEEIGQESQEEEAKTYWTNKIWGSNGPKFCRVLAALLLMEMEDRIKDFIDKSLTDDCLPLDEDVFKFPNWRAKDTDSFQNYQWKFIVPFFSPKPNGVHHYDLGEEHIKPWAQTSDRPLTSSALQESQIVGSNLSAISQLGGGYGEVYQVIIHPWQHDFHDTLQSLSAHENIFALKRLYSSSKGDFDKETHMLKRFGGRRPNIVTLLATIARRESGKREQYYLLFPWAESDLLGYWKTKWKPNRDHETFNWISDQCHGIIVAIDFIHDPKELNSDGKRLYGRHGDIKPENILWFKREGKEILVLSDLGLSAVHREVSRSNRPGMSIPVTPNYRPPECDMEGPLGYVSRSFDIWTLGCLFLEFVVWILYGWEGRNKFNSERYSPYINGVETNVYFDVMRLANEANQHVFKIKDKVVEWFVSLHKHPDCSRYIHDFLDLIQERMLVVESDDPPIKRIGAPELLDEMNKLRENCSNPGYCLTPCPRQTEHHTQLPVKAPLNENALRVIGERREPLEQYSGRTRSANPRHLN